MAWQEITDPVKIQELRLAGLIWYTWGNNHKIPLSADLAQLDSLETVRSFIRDGFRYYVLLEE